MQIRHVGVGTGAPQPQRLNTWVTGMHHHALYLWHTLTHRLSGGHSEWICVARGYRIVPSDRQIGLLCATWPAVTPSVLAQKNCTRYLTLHIVSLSLLFCVCVYECECWFYYCQTALHRGGGAQHLCSPMTDMSFEWFMRCVWVWWINMVRQAKAILLQTHS